MHETLLKNLDTRSIILLSNHYNHSKLGTFPDILARIPEYSFRILVL